MVTSESGAIKVIRHTTILCLSVEQNETKMLKTNKQTKQTPKQQQQQNKIYKKTQNQPNQKTKQVRGTQI